LKSAPDLSALFIFLMNAAPAAAAATLFALNQNISQMAHFDTHSDTGANRHKVNCFMASFVD